MGTLNNKKLSVIKRTDNSCLVFSDKCMHKLPKSKKDNIAIRGSNNEVLVYNSTTRKSFSLNETAAIIFNACDGVTLLDDLKRRYTFTETVIYLALDQLRNANLINDYRNDNSNEMSRDANIGNSAKPIALPLVEPLNK